MTNARFHRASLSAPATPEQYAAELKRMQAKIDDLLRENHKLRKDRDVYQARIDELVGELEGANKAIDELNEHI